jgi:hypothetical protein
VNTAGLALAVFAAVGFAVSTALQHHANSRIDAGPAPSLLRQPWWIIGQLVALTAFSLHAWALRAGLLMIVQPIVVSGIVLAIPARAALARRLPHARELGTVALTALGLSVFLVAVHPSTTTTGQSTSAALAATLAGGVAALVASQWARGRTGSARVAGFGAAAGILFGLTAGLVKIAVTTVPHTLGAMTALSAWPAWLVPIVGLGGVVLNQKAYRAGPLSASMPLLNIVDVVVSVAFGIVVFGEMPAHDLRDLAWQAGGLTLMLLALRRLATSHGVPASRSTASDLIYAGTTA